MRRNWIAAVGLTLASVLVAASIAVAAGPSPESTTAQGPGLAEPFAEEGCFANVICVYAQPNFEERSNFTFPCVPGGTIHTSVWRSIRNRCGNKSDFLRLNGAGVACMNPGGERPNPGPFNEIVIPEKFGALC